MASDNAVSALYRYRFGSNAEFDEMRFELRVGGVPVDVQHRPLQLLALLLAHVGEVVSYAQFDAALWSKRITAGATADNVLANAVSKLRAALGPDNAQRLATLPKVGYRLAGPVEREAVGQRGAQRLDLAAGQRVPGREHLLLERLLGRSHHSEVWLARHAKTGEPRVYKFTVGPERLAALRREATVYRYLRSALGPRADIARVIDWNFGDAPFYLECAYGGPNLAEWAAADGAGLARLPAGARLALFLQIADAVAAAHGVAVLHRDIKPGNVLIDTGANGDGAPQACLTDFGSAALLEPDRLDDLHITRLGLTLPPGSATPGGTPLYLAPELAAGEPQTVASEIYALGVVLYQLTAGDLQRPMASGWQRDVADPLLADDIARATDADPARRPASVAEFAAGLRSLAERHAARTAAAERAAGFAAAQAALERARARRPWLIGSVATLLAALGVSLWGVAAERRAAATLAQRNELVVALNRLLVDDVIGAANPAVSGRADVTVADALVGATQAIDGKFAQAPPAVRGGLHHAMQRALSELSRIEPAVDQGRLAVADFTRAGAARGDAISDLQDARLRLAVDLGQLSRFADGAAVLRDAGRDAAPLSAQPAEFRARLLYAQSWVADGDTSLQVSARLLGEAWALVRPLSVEAAPWRDKIAFALADTLTLLGRFAEGESLYRELLAQQQAKYGARHLRALVTQVGLGNNLTAQGKLDDALTLLRPTEQALAEVLGPGHRMTLSAADSIGTIYLRQRRPADAYAQWARVHDGFAKLMGAGSSATLTVLTNMATARLHGGDAAAAEPLLRDALRQLRLLMKDDAAQAQQVRYVLADCLLDLGRADEAQHLLDGLDARVIAEAEQSAHWPARLAYQRGRALLAQGQRAAALPLAEAAAAGLRDAAPDGDDRVDAAAVGRLLASARAGGS